MRQLWRGRVRKCDNSPDPTGTIDSVSNQADNRRNRPRREPITTSGRRPGRTRGRSSALRRSEQAAATSSRERFVPGQHGDQPGQRATRKAEGSTKAGPLGARWAVWRPHVKRFLPALLINHAVTVTIAIAIAVIVGIASEFSFIPAVIGSVWMLANAAPIAAQGVTLGFVPLLPAMLIVYGHSRRVTKILGDRISVRGLRVFGVLALAVPMVLTLIAWLMLWDAGRVFDIPTPNLGMALLTTLVVNGAAVVVGMRSRIWRALLLRRNLQTWPVGAVRLALNFLAWMCVAGLMGIVIYLVANWSAVKASYDIATGFWAGLGLSLMALAYLPNMMVAAASILLGGEFNFGNGVSSVFSVTNVELPPLPLLAALPNEPIPGGEFLLAIPAIVAVGTVFRFARGRSYMESPVLVAMGAGVATFVITLIVAWLNSGEVGVLGSAGPVAWLTASVAAAWIVLPSMVLMWYFSRAGQHVVEDISDATSTTQESTNEIEAQVDAEDAAAGEAYGDFGDEGDYGAGAHEADEDNAEEDDADQDDTDGAENTESAEEQEEAPADEDEEATGDPEQDDNEEGRK